MNEDLLKEVLEIKSELRALNHRLDKVTDKLLENQKNECISTDIKDIENSVNFMEQQLRPIPIEEQFGTKPIGENQKFTPIREKVNFIPQKSIKNSNLEAKIGKNVMGILASLLIFIGIASFVVFVFQDMSEILKFALMHIFYPL